jgi:hypothetical protein
MGAGDAEAGAGGAGVVGPGTPSDKL